MDARKRPCDLPLAQAHYNFGGLKWRKEMVPFATKIAHKAHDGVDFYCKFATLESFINGYWAFLSRAPYSGWEAHSDDAEDFMRFIGPIYASAQNYANKVLALVAEAEGLLAAPPSPRAPLAAARPAGDTATHLGTIVIDPGHGGTTNAPGSSANNAISTSGVKEKKLTLDFCLILRDELLRQSEEAGETIKVVLTRTTDVNLSGVKRAGMAFTEQAKAFLCLHFNGSSNTSVSGAETFFSGPGQYRSEPRRRCGVRARRAHGTDGGHACNQSDCERSRCEARYGFRPGALGVLNDSNLGNDRAPRKCVSAYIEAESSRIRKWTNCWCPAPIHYTDPGHGVRGDSHSRAHEGDRLRCKIPVDVDGRAERVFLQVGSCTACPVLLRG